MLQFHSRAACTMATVPQAPNIPTLKLGNNDCIVMQDLELNTPEHPDLQRGVARGAVAVHRAVESTAARFAAELRRHVYVTPTSYLEQLRTFLALLAEKRGAIATQRGRLAGGLDKLAATAAQVAAMQAELVQLQPVLEKTAGACVFPSFCCLAGVCDALGSRCS